VVGLEAHPYGDNIREKIHRSASLLRTLVSANKPVGAFLTVALHPSEAVVGVDFLGCLLESRLLLLLPADQPIQFVPHGWVVHDGTPAGRDRPTPENIQSHVARVCRYPIAMMRADPSRVAELLNARRGLRLSEFTGAFRSRAGDASEGLVAATDDVPN
jgi:hypothetical protein